MRLAATAHTSRPWRIHELTSDFRLEDVWALPTPGAYEDFPRLVRLVTALDPESSPLLSRLLWQLRWRLGQLLEWDAPQITLGSSMETLRDRLPADLRKAPAPVFAALPFNSLYLLDDEFAAESANRTMHGVLHLGWVPDDSGTYLGQLAILVKPNGTLGKAYMAAIRPFRHLIVYPALIGQIGAAWRRDGFAIPARQVAA